MATATSEVRVFTTVALATPAGFTEFCSNRGQPWGDIIDSRSVTGPMNATFQTNDRGPQEVLAAVCEMGENEVVQAVEAVSLAFYGDSGQAWRDLGARTHRLGQQTG